MTTVLDNLDELLVPDADDVQDLLVLTNGGRRLVITRQEGQPFGIACSRDGFELTQNDAVTVLNFIAQDHINGVVEAFVGPWRQQVQEQAARAEQADAGWEQELQESGRLRRVVESYWKVLRRIVDENVEAVVDSSDVLYAVRELLGLDGRDGSAQYDGTGGGNRG